MKPRLIVYRTADRPRYTARTWPRLVEASNPESWVVIVENSGDCGNSDQNLSTFDAHRRDRTLVHVTGKQLGVNRPIFTACDEFRSWRDHDPHYVLVTDDDILLPDGWDDECIRMIETGRWDVTGIGRWKRLRDMTLVGEGDEAGYESPVMSGGGCAFPYELLHQGTLSTKGKSGLNNWSKQFRCAWSPRMVKREIDRHKDPDWDMSG